jgi:hypothetical protein
MPAEAKRRWADEGNINAILRLLYRIGRIDANVVA